MNDRTTRGGGFYYVVQESLRVLYADDDPILREFAAVHLATETCDVVTAEDGVAALEEIGRIRPDILLLDLEMPRMDGFEALHRLRGNPSTAHLPVIVVTGREDVAAIDRAFEAGATSFVSKPINWRLLSYQIRYVCRTSAAEQALAAETAAAEAREIQAAGQAMRLAQEGSRFIATAVAAAPALRARAGAFADAIEAVIAGDEEAEAA